MIVTHYSSTPMMFANILLGWDTLLDDVFNGDMITPEESGTNPEMFSCEYRTNYAMSIDLDKDREMLIAGKEKHAEVLIENPDPMHEYLTRIGWK